MDIKNIFLYSILSTLTLFVFLIVNWIIIKIVTKIIMKTKDTKKYSDSKYLNEENLIDRSSEKFDNYFYKGLQEDGLSFFIPIIFLFDKYVEVMDKLYQRLFEGGNEK